MTTALVSQIPVRKRSQTTMKTKAGSVERKIVDLYKQGLDSTRLNAEGAAPL